MPSSSVSSAPAQLSLFDAEPAPPAAAAVAPVAPPSATAPYAAAPDARPAPPADRSRRSAREIRFGEHHVSYALRRARRRSIGFLVGPEGLTVSAPRWVELAEIEAALREKSAWILRKLREQRELSRRLEAARVDWRDGASLPFLGEPVIIVLDPRVGATVLHAAEGALPGVPRLTLHLGLPQGAEPEQVRDTVQAWLQRQARRIFEERVALYAPRLGVRVRRLALSAAASRWGSASADGSIRLNWRLVHFGMPVIDYVVTHELAHLIEMNHSPAFWDVVRGALPGFEAARGTLRTEVLPVFE